MKNISFGEAQQLIKKWADECVEEEQIAQRLFEIGVMRPVRDEVLGIGAIRVFVSTVIASLLEEKGQG